MKTPTWSRSPLFGLLPVLVSACPAAPEQPLVQPAVDLAPVEPLPTLARSHAALSLANGEGCWIRDDGRVVCFTTHPTDVGIGGPVLGVPPGVARVLPGIRDVVQIDGIAFKRGPELHPSRHCAVTAAGEVHCFGMNDLGLWRPPRPWGARAVHSRDTFSYFLDSNGRLGWYADSRHVSTAPAFVDGVVDAVDLELAYWFGCARTSKGEIWCFDFEDEAPPGHVGRVDVNVGIARLERSGAELYVVDTHQSVHRVALDDRGWQLEPTGVTDVVDVSDHCAIRANGVVTCGLDGVPWDVKGPTARAIATSYQRVVCLIAEADGSVHCAKNKRPAQRIDELGPARTVDFIDERPCALLDSGEVRCMNERLSKPDSPELRGDTMVAVGGANGAICVIASGRVMCSFPLDDPGTWKTLVFPFEDALGFETFGDQSCVRRPDGLYCTSGWGRYEEIPLGPVQGLGEVAEVAVGWGFTCARERTGSVRCWGVEADFGQLGDGQKRATLAPVEVLNIDDAQAIDASTYAVAVVRSNGEVWRWGMGIPVPEPVPGLVEVARIAMGDDSRLCALHDDGSVSCMRGSEVFEVPNLIAVELEFVDERACALTRGPDRALVCWVHNPIRGVPIGTYDHGAALGLDSLDGARGLTLDVDAWLWGMPGPGDAGCIDLASERGPTCWRDGELWYPFADPIETHEPTRRSGR